MYSSERKGHMPTPGEDAVKIVGTKKENIQNIT